MPSEEARPKLSGNHRGRRGKSVAGKVQHCCWQSSEKTSQGQKIEQSDWFREQPISKCMSLSGKCFCIVVLTLSVCLMTIEWSGVALQKTLIFMLISVCCAFTPNQLDPMFDLEWRWQVGKPQPKSVPAARDSQTRRLSGSAFSSQENRNFVLLFLGSNIFPWIGSLICNLTSCYLRVGWRY